MSSFADLLAADRWGIDVDELSEEDRATIRDGNTWLSVLKKLGYRKIKQSSTGKIDVLCVFHKERTPSLRMWPSGHFYCHGCQAQGDILDFVLQAQKGSVRDALILLAPEADSNQLSLIEES